MKKIRLTNGGFTIVDDKDFDWLNQWSWGFDGRYVRRREGNTKIYMHCIINETPNTKHTDHINRNELDNRRDNLRTATPAENIRNTGLRNTNKSGHKGVWFWKKRNKWQAYLWNNYKKIHLGVFVDIKDAIKARKEGEKLHWKNE